jgi:two-component system sensor histidine kinase AgrC
MLYNFLVNLIFTTICGIIIYIFTAQNFNVSLKSIKSLLFIPAFGLSIAIISTSLSGITFIVDMIVKPAMILLFSIFLIYKILKLSIPHSVISFCIMGVGLYVGIAITPVISSLFGLNISPESTKNSITIYFISNLFVTIISILFIISIYPIRHIFTKVKNNKAMAIDIIFTFSIVVISCGIQGIYRDFDLRLSLIVLVFTILYMCRDIWKYNRFFKQERIKAEFEQQKFYNTQMENLLNEMRRFKHDWANNLSVIQLMLKTKKFINAETYLAELIGENAHIFNSSLFNIKNAGLFGILSAKISLAIEKEVNFELNVLGEIRDIPNIKITELCEIIGIFIDNAIEASEKSNEKSIEMTFSNAGKGIEFEIKNSCSEIPVINQIFEDGYSTKGTNRGHGLYIVKSILKKYDNILLNANYDNGEKRFHQCLVIS